MATPQPTHTQPEEWRDIPRYEGRYQASNHGRVRSLDRMVHYKNGVQRLHKGRVLRPGGNPSGHLMVNLIPRKNEYIHRLVLEAFVGPCPEGMECCHNDGDPSNNYLQNLRWDTPSANGFDHVKHGNHYQKVKTHCPYGHVLRLPNLMPSRWESMGHRSCLACSRCRGYLQKRPELRSEFKTIADQYYASIMIGDTP